MCIICLEFQKYRDFADARRMVEAARREPNNIDPAHLNEVEEVLYLSEEQEKSQSTATLLPVQPSK